MKSIVIFILLTIFISSCSSKNPLEKVLDADLQQITTIIQDPEKYEVQIIYSQIDRDETGKIHFTDYKYYPSDSVYFYPASAVKFPVALMALEKLEKLQQKGIQIDRQSYFKTENDTIYTTIEKAITEIFAVSDNKAYNKLFEFLGQDYINSSLASKKIKGRISHRLSTANGYALATQPIIFKKKIKDSSILYTQASITNTKQQKLQLKKIIKGVGFIQNDTLIHKPMDFSVRNYIPLQSLHDIMKRVHFPELYSKNERFNINKENLEFVQQAMKTLPYQAGYDKNEYYDGYVKFFMYGDTKEEIPKHIEIYNKVGYAYGYLTDCAYIKDTKNDIEFIVSATLHVNKNQIFNDDTYEYDTIGIPFLAELGKQIHTLEKKRKQ